MSVKINPFDGQLIQFPPNYSPATKVIAPAGSGFAADSYTTGTADDVAIQAVLDSITKGVVLCKIGDYQITAKLKIPSDVYLIGEGFKTRFIATSALADHMIKNKNATDSNIQIKDIYLDCTATNSGNGTVISLSNVTDGLIQGVETNGGIGAGIVISSCTRTFVRQTHAHNSTWSGIWLQQNNTNCGVDQCVSNANGTPNQSSGHGIEIGNLTNNNNSFIRISNNHTYNNQNGIRFYGFGQHHIDIIGNICHDNGQAAPTIDGNGIGESTGNTAGTIACHDINVIGNVCYNNSAEGISFATNSSGVPPAYGYNVTGNICTDNRSLGMFVTNTSDSIVSNNIVSRNYDAGILIQSTCSNMIVSGNQSYNNGQVVSGKQGLEINGNYITATNNQCFDDQITPTQYAGIVEGTSGADNNTITGNTCYGNTNYQIRIYGANTEVGHNIGAITDSRSGLHNGGVYNTHSGFAAIDAISTVKYARVGSNGVPNNITDGDLSINRLIIGNSVIGSTEGVVKILSTNTDTASQSDSQSLLQLTITPTLNSLTTIRNLFIQNLWNPTTGITQTTLRGIDIENRVKGDGLVSTISGIRGGAMFIDNSSAATTQATNVYAMEAVVYARPTGTSTATIDTGIGFDTSNMLASTGLTATTITGFRMVNPGFANTITTLIGLDIQGLTRGATNIGLRIAAPSSGATANYALQLSDTGGTAAGGITFGTDIQFYRNAANNLTFNNILLSGLKNPSSSQDAVTKIYANSPVVVNDEIVTNNGEIIYNL